MKRFNLLAAFFIPAIVFSNLGSAQSAYLKIGDIKGESTDTKHKDWIIIESLSQGISRPTGGATGATRARSAVTMQEFVITKKIDMSSPKLMEAGLKGQIIPEVIVDLTVGNKNSFYTIKMTNVLVSSFSNSGDCGSQCEVVEQLSLNFEKIEWTYTDARGGKTTAAYNVATNK